MIPILVVALLLGVAEGTSTIRSTPGQDINLQCNPGQAVVAITNIFVPSLKDFGIQLICTEVASSDSNAQSDLGPPTPKAPIPLGGGPGCPFGGSQNCQKGEVLCGLKSPFVQGQPRQIQLVCCKSQETVEGATGCTLTPLNLTYSDGDNPKLCISKPPVVPKNGCGKFQTKGVQVDSQGNLLIKSCPMRNKQDKYFDKATCKQVTQNAPNTCKSYTGNGVIVQTTTTTSSTSTSTVTEQQVDQITNQDEVKQDEQSYEKQHPDEVETSTTTTTTSSSSSSSSSSPSSSNNSSTSSTSSSSSTSGSGSGSSSETTETSETDTESSGSGSGSGDYEYDTETDTTNTTETDTSGGKKRTKACFCMCKPKTCPKEEHHDHDVGHDKGGKSGHDKGGKSGHDKGGFSKGKGPGPKGPGPKGPGKSRKRRTALVGLEDIMRKKRDTTKTVTTTRTVTTTTTKVTKRKVTHHHHRHIKEVEWTMTSTSSNGKTTITLTGDGEIEQCPPDRCHCDDCRPCHRHHKGKGWKGKGKGKGPDM